jgi:hypothetical protein
MATVTIDATNPSAAVNFAVLRNCIGKMLEAARSNVVTLAPDEYQLLWEMYTGATDGKTAGTSTQAVVTY